MEKNAITTATPVAPNTWYELTIAPGASDLLYGKGIGTTIIDVFSGENLRTVGDLIENYKSTTGVRFAGHFIADVRAFDALADSDLPNAGQHHEQLVTYHAGMAESFGLICEDCTPEPEPAPKHAAPGREVASGLLNALGEISATITGIVGVTGVDGYYKGTGVSAEHVRVSRYTTTLSDPTTGESTLVRQWETKRIDSNGLAHYQWALADDLAVRAELSDVFVASSLASGEVKP